MTGAVEKELNKQIRLLNAEQKKSLLGFIKTIFPGKEKERISVEQYNKELDEAEAQIERGEYYTHEEVLEHLKKHKRGSK